MLRTPAKWGSRKRHYFVRSVLGRSVRWIPARFTDFCKYARAAARLTRCDGYLDGTKRVFAGVFRAGTDGHALWVSEWPAFEAKWKELSGQGLRLVSVDSYLDGGKRIFTGVYRAGTDGHMLLAGIDWETFRAKSKQFSGQGLRLIDVASYPDGGTQRFAGAFRSGTDAFAMRRGRWHEFNEDWQQLTKANRRLVAVDTFVPGQEE